MSDHITLKVKIKSLAAESGIIRKEENKRGHGVTLRNKLHNHRVTTVREEARYSLIAYAYMRGKKHPEHPNSKFVNWSRVKSIVNRFSREEITIEGLREWAGDVLARAA